MDESVRKLVKNALGINEDLEDWNDLECELCASRAASHVLVSIDDIRNHSDVVILRALCDSCFEDDVLSCCWMHKGPDDQATSEETGTDTENGTQR